MLRIIALHGFTMNGAEMRRQLGPLGDRLVDCASLACPDAPHPCHPESVARVYAPIPGRLPPDPALMWWSANDDGSVYRGWESTLERIRSLLLDGPTPLLLGFSQGAILTAAIAALSAARELPEIRGAVMIAGAPPRAKILLPWFADPIGVPSLHVAGSADRVMGARPDELAACFEQKCLRFVGNHRIPTRGAAADAIVEFISERV